MSLEAELDELTRQFVDAFNRGDAGGAAACYTADAIYANPGPVVVIGRTAIQAAFEQEYATGARILGFKTVSAEGNETCAWAVQRFPTNMGDTVLMIGLRREAGRWLIAAEAVTA
jgi:ketosteroid isomerase-like protein